MLYVVFIVGNIQQHRIDVHILSENNKFIPLVISYLGLIFRVYSTVRLPVKRDVNIIRHRKYPH